MKILIFSDSHGSSSKMDSALDMHIDADIAIHLGDGTREFKLICESRPEIRSLFVCGNFEDPFGKDPLSSFVNEICGKRILITHGHSFSVKSGLGRLLQEAVHRKADIVLFGHTHVPLEKYVTEDVPYPIYLFNPGSISRPRDGHPSYGILDIRGSSVLFSIGHI